MRKSTLLVSLFIEKKQSKQEEVFDQSNIEKEVKFFYQKQYWMYPTYANKEDILKFIGKKKVNKFTRKSVLHWKKK